MAWADAYELAERIAKKLKPTVARLKCVGSVRRRKARVGDIEFLAHPYFDTDLLGKRTPYLGAVRAALLDIGTWKKGGDRMMQITDVFGQAGVQLDLYIQHDPATWGVLLGMRTGPAELGRYVVTTCQQHGRKVRGGYAVMVPSEEIVPTETEEEFFALAGVEMVAPRLRDAQAVELWRAG